MPPRAPNPTPLPGPPRGLTGVDLSRWINNTCTRADAEGGLGFTAAGVCAADSLPGEDIWALEQWLKGQQGRMTYMEDNGAERVNPRDQTGAMSVLMVADRYAARDSGTERERASEEAAAGPRGRIARYARGRDYHSVIKRRVHRLADALRRVFPHEQFTTFTDTAPVLERRFAQRAGLGWLAKNAMLIHPVHGSYMVLGGFFTTLDLPAPPQPEQQSHTDHCGTCTRCIDACPTGAIARQALDGGPAPVPRVNGSRCISYLTIEHEGMIEPSLAGKTGDWLFGCDVCQEVCPHNSLRPSQPDAPVRSEYSPIRATLPLLDVLNWGGHDRSLLTVSSMKRATAEMLRRNAVLATANAYRAHPDPALLVALRNAAQSESDLVKWTAVDALESLGVAPG